MLLENQSSGAEMNMDETSTEKATSSSTEQRSNSQEPKSQEGAIRFPFNDRVSSAAAAMLSLSSSLPIIRGEMDVKLEPGSPMSGFGGSVNGSPAAESHMYDQDGIMRRERAFVPELRKDDQYWIKRRKNNEAAKKSREKRRAQDKVLTQTVSSLTDDVNELKNELDEMKQYFGYPTTVKFDPALVECFPGHRKLPVEIESDSEPHEPPHRVPNGPTPNETLIPAHKNSIPIPSPKIPLPMTPVLLPHGTPVPMEAGMPLLLVPNAFSSPRVSSPPQPESQQQSMDTNRQVTAEQEHVTAAHSAYACEPKNGYMSVKRHKLSAEHQMFDRQVPNHTERLETESFSDGQSSSYSNPNSSYSNPNYTEDHFRSQEWKGIPHKLRHKYNSISLSCTSDSDATRELPSNAYHSEQDAPLNMVLGDDCTTSSNFSDSDSGSASCSASHHGDKQYIQRRKRNNEASRKSRKNKRITELRHEQLADELQDENHKLRSEMQYLSGEIQYLKELFREKSEAERRGERFVAPVHVLDKLDQRASARL